MLSVVIIVHSGLLYLDSLVFLFPE